MVIRQIERIARDLSQLLNLVTDYQLVNDCNSCNVKTDSTCKLSQYKMKPTVSGCTYERMILSVFSAYMYNTFYSKIS